MPRGGARRPGRRRSGRGRLWACTPRRRGRVPPSLRRRLRARGSGGGSGRTVGRGGGWVGGGGGGGRPGRMSSSHSGGKIPRKHTTPDASYSRISCSETRRSGSAGSTAALPAAAAPPAAQAAAQAATAAAGWAEGQRALQSAPRRRDAAAVIALREAEAPLLRAAAQSTALPYGHPCLLPTSLASSPESV